MSLGSPDYLPSRTDSEGGALQQPREPFQSEFELAPFQRLSPMRWALRILIAAMTNFAHAKSFASPSQTVDVVVFTPSVSGKTPIHLKNLPLPLKFDDVARELIQAGRRRKFR